MIYLRLIRWQNLLIIALTQYMTRYFLIQPFFKIQQLELQISNLNFFLLVLTTVMIAAGGYIINDYFDLKIDPINKPDKMILGAKINATKAETAYYIINALAVAIGVYLGYRVGSISIGLLFMVCATVLYFYSLKYKRLLLWGNVSIALLSAFTVIIVWLFEFFAVRNNGIAFVQGLQAYWGVTYFVLAYASFAFISTFIREIIKDIEDIEGDTRWGCTTLPIVAGIPVAKKIAASISILGIILVAWFQYVLKEINHGYISAILMIVVQVPFAYLAYKIMKAKEKEDFHFISNIVKIIMVLGILTMFAIFKSVI